jgi:hypothetical protein
MSPSTNEAPVQSFVSERVPQSRVAFILRYTTEIKIVFLTLSSQYDDYVLLSCEAMQSYKWLPMLRIGKPRMSHCDFLPYLTPNVIVTTI